MCFTGAVQKAIAAAGGNKIVQECKQLGEYICVVFVIQCCNVSESVSLIRIKLLWLNIAWWEANRAEGEGTIDFPPGTIQP